MEENSLAPITSNSFSQELKILGSEEVELSLNINNISYSVKLEPRGKDEWKPLPLWSIS